MLHNYKDQLKMMRTLQSFRITEIRPVKKPYLLENDKYHRHRQKALKMCLEQ